MFDEPQSVPVGLDWVGQMHATPIRYALGI
jgi:hypothetical protein